LDRNNIYRPIKQQDLFEADILDDKPLKDEKGNVYNSFKTTEMISETQWKMGRKALQSDKNKQVIMNNNFTPTVTFRFTHAFKGIFGSNFEYTNNILSRYKISDTSIQAISTENVSLSGLNMIDGVALHHQAADLTAISAINNRSIGSGARSGRNSSLKYRQP